MQRSSSMPVKPQHLEVATLKRSQEHETLVVDTDRQKSEMPLQLTDQHADNDIKNTSSCEAIIRDVKVSEAYFEDRKKPQHTFKSLRPAEEEEKITGPARREHVLLHVFNPIRRLFRRISESVDETVTNNVTNNSTKDKPQFVNEDDARVTSDQKTDDNSNLQAPRATFTV